MKPSNLKKKYRKRARRIRMEQGSIWTARLRGPSNTIKNTQNRETRPLRIEVREIGTFTYTYICTYMYIYERILIFVVILVMDYMHRSYIIYAYIYV